MIYGIVGTKEEIKIVKLYAEMQGWINTEPSVYEYKMNKSNPPRLFKLYFVIRKVYNTKDVSHVYNFRLVDSFRKDYDKVNKKWFVSRNKKNIYNMIKNNGPNKL